MSDLEICIYDRVTLTNGKQGEVQFMGNIEGKGATKIFYGVKLDDQQGKNNGTANNIQYFECFNNYGIFVKAEKIKKSEATQLNQVLPRVCIGDRIKVKDKRQHGILRFVGIVEFDKGCYYGVELEEPLGENDGSVDERQYFECPDYYGMFCKVSNIASAKMKTSSNKLKVKKKQKKSSSDISQIKSNYKKNQKHKESLPSASRSIVAPPPPMSEPVSPSNTTKPQNNLLDQDIESMGFIQLKARCGMEQLSTFGTKKQLLTRLRQHLQKTHSSPPTQQPQQIQKYPPTQSSQPQSTSQPQPPAKNNKKQQNSYSSNSSLDPELHDLDPAKDDFFQPIATATNDTENRQGSIVYNASSRVNATNAISALADGDEDAAEHQQEHKQYVNAPKLVKAQSNASPTHTNLQPLKSKIPPLKVSKSTMDINEANAAQTSTNTNTNNNAHPAPPPNEGAQDWIMLPDPSSGKMYYANLKTKETRWQPPPGFGVTETNLNPGYNPQLQFANNGANMNANQWQTRPNPAVWQSFSTQNLSQYANPGVTNPNMQGYQQQNAGYLGRQMSAFATNQQNAYQQNPQWTRSVGTFQAQGANNMNLGQYQNQPKAKSAMNMGHKPMANKANPNAQQRKESRKPMDAASPQQQHHTVDPLAKLEAAKWKKTVDQNTGREYWYHRETKQTTWEPPPAVLKVSAESAVGGISGMQEIAKADWEDSESEYSSGSGSYYEDDDTESEEDDTKKNQYQQPAPQGNYNAVNNGYPPNNGYNQWGNQQGQAQGQGQGYNNQWQPQAQGGGAAIAQNQWNQGGGGYGNNAYGYQQQQQQQQQQQHDARQMYLKPAGQVNNQNEEKTAEDNPWISAEEAKSRVIVRDTLKRYWQIGAEQSFKLDAWAKQHYYMSGHKKGLFGKKQQTVSDILSYADFSKLKQPLNKESLSEEKLKEQVLQTWKNINSYMGIRKSGKSSEGHVEKLVRYALKGDSKLRNEIYCQLAKQTTKNPKLQSLLKGWKLLLICCSFFPPSDEFVDYLACFIWNNTQQPNEIGQYAIKALHALDATMLSGGRKFPPLPLEIVKLENLQPIPLNIYFINGMKCKQVLVTSQTRAKQVIETLAQTFNFKHGEAFGLYEMEPNIAPLDKMKKHYIKREMMSQQEKINDLVRMPFERELEEDDRMLDVIASWLKRDQSKRKNKSGGKSSKKKHHKSSKNVRFVLKVKTFRKPMEKQFSHMGAKANFLTHAWHVVNDFYPISVVDEEFAFDLAALQLQGTYGPKPKLPPIVKQNSKFLDHSNQSNVQHAFYKQGLIAYDLHKYLGQAILKKYLPGDRNQCEHKILQCRASKYSQMSRQDCWLRYAKMLRSNKKLYNYFGCAWYRGVRIQANGDLNEQSQVKQIFSKKSKGKSIIKTDRNINTNDLLVGINEHAISFVNPITQCIVERYEMEEILTFGYRSNAFLFVAGTLMTQSKMQIATMHGKAMNRLVRTHIDLRVRDAEKKGQKIKNVPKTNDI